MQTEKGKDVLKTKVHSPKSCKTWSAGDGSSERAEPDATRQPGTYKASGQYWAGWEGRQWGVSETLKGFYF